MVRKCTKINTNNLVFRRHYDGTKDVDCGICGNQFDINEGGYACEDNDPEKDV